MVHVNVSIDTSSFNRLPENLQRNEALKICQNFLGDFWRESEETFTLRQLSGGVSNFLYLASVHCNKTERSEKVIIRVYGPLLKNDNQLVIKENIVFAILSEKSIGPKFLGVFSGGRLEEYYEADSLTSSEMRDPKISSVIAAKIGAYHKLEMPLKKDGEWYFQDLNRMIDQVLSLSKDDFILEENKNLFNFFTSFDLKKEAESMKEILLSVKSPIVFCHNDCQAGNILKKRHIDSLEIQLIDFEFSNYNHRAFDIANHFSEFMFDNNADNYLGWTADESAFPSQHEQRTFIRSYLSAYQKIFVKDDEDDILNEVSAFKMASSFYWSIWAVLVTIGQEDSSWAYMKYGERRFHMYYKQKEEFLSKQCKV